MWERRQRNKKKKCKWKGKETSKEHIGREKSTQKYRRKRGMSGCCRKTEER